MKSKLQYLYSISVFFGVLVTAYMMMSGSENDRLLTLRGRTRAPSLRADAQAVDPAVSQLMEMENALNQFKMDGEDEEDEEDEEAKESLRLPAEKPSPAK